MKNENRINLFIVIGVIVVVAMVAFVFLANNMTTNYVKKITISELKQKIDNKDTFILVITQDSCTHCKSYLPTLTKIGRENNITFYDVSQTNLSSEDATYLKNVANISGTPTTVFIVNGEENSTSNRLEGNVPEYRVIERLKAMGYIKSDNDNKEENKEEKSEDTNEKNN